MHLNFSTNFPTKDRIFLKKPCALQLRNYSTFSTQLIRPNYSLLIALLQKIVSIPPPHGWFIYLNPLQHPLGGFLPSIWTLVIPFLVTSNILGIYLYPVRNFKEIDLFYSKFTARKDLVGKIVWTFCNKWVSCLCFIYLCQAFPLLYWQMHVKNLLLSPNMWCKDLVPQKKRKGSECVCVSHWTVFVHWTESGLCIRDGWLRADP